MSTKYLLSENTVQLTYELQTEKKKVSLMMGCGSSSDVAQTPAPKNENNGTEVVAHNNTNSTPQITEVPKKIAEPSLAFEIPIEDIKLPRKLPPLRFQKLEDSLPQTDVTLEKLKQRQAEADERRKKILDMRVKSARHLQGRPIKQSS